MENKHTQYDLAQMQSLPLDAKILMTQARIREWYELEKEPNRFQSLKETHPKLWEYCMRPIEEKELGMKEVLDYVGVDYE